MDQVKKKRNVWNRAGRIAIKTILFIVLFFLIVILLVQTGPVQNFIRKKTVAWLEKKLQTKVTVDRIYVGLPKNIVLENIYVEDREKDTLLSGGRVKANLNIFRLIFKNEVDIKSIELENITTKIKRQLPDTTYNFQFVVDAFAPKSTSTDTTVSSIAIRSVVLNKIRVIYKDVVSGSDMEGWLDHLDTKIDIFDPEHLHFDVPNTNINGFTARIYQVKPLARPEPEIKDIIEAKQPTLFKLDFKEANLQNIKVDFRNDVSATYSMLDIGTLSVKPNNIDLNNRIIDLQNIFMENTTANIRLGKKEQARIVVKEVEQEAKSQVQAGWRIKVASIDLKNNNLQFDNDNNPRITKGMDYGHLKGEAFTLQAQDLLLSLDSIAGKINKAEFKEQSGFVLEQLQTEFLYSNNESYLKDLFLKTPGTELKRYASLTYDSYKALAENFSNTQIEADISNSYIQVKDVLTFAPQLRFQPAFANPDAVWYLNLQGTGTLQSMHIQDLQFRGLKNTRIDASGTLATNSDPGRSGATLTIRKLHTNQSDIALFTGRRLSNAQLNIPEEFDVNGTVAGSINNLSTNLNIATSAGAASVNGRFTNLSHPNTATYTALVKTNSLQLGEVVSSED